MRPIRYLITGDPARTIQPQFDTSLLMASELLRRGIEVDYCDLFKTDLQKNSEDYLTALPVQRILFADNDDPCFIGLEPSRKVNAYEEYDVVLNRKDPPVDEFYIRSSEHFSKLGPQVLQINNPDQTWRHKEHLLPQRYPGIGAETHYCESFESLLSTVRKMPTEAVCKPSHECSGIGIEFLANNAPESQIKDFWEKWKPGVVVQPYIKDIENSGDLRILVINGKILGQVLRVPQKGSRLANLHRGGRGEYYEINDWHREVVRIVSQDLKQFGLYLLGLDFIGKNLTEVNITSPTALPLINKLMGTQGHILLIDEIESLRKELHNRHAH